MRPVNSQKLFLPRKDYSARWRLAGTILAVLLGASRIAWAQVATGSVGEAAAAGTVNFTELANQEALNPSGPPQQRVIPFMPTRRLRPERPIESQPEKLALPAAAMDLPVAAVPSPGLAANFEALGDNNGSIPPDTMGAVGPNHLMVTLNTQVRIQNRSGTALSTVTLETFWTGLGASGVFDPKLTYDPFNDRWIFTAVSNRRLATSSVVIGVSQTSDPTGTWNRFRVDADSGNSDWADYPSLGFNKDWIVVSVNMFANSNDDFEGTHIYVFNKSNLYNNVGATHTLFQTFGVTQVPPVSYDNSLGTIYLVEENDGNIGGTTGQLYISTVEASTSEACSGMNQTFTNGLCYHDIRFDAIVVGSPWASAAPGMSDFAPQLGTVQKIQTNDSRIQDVVYRNGALWATQTVFLPDTSPTRSAVQWWQITPGVGNPVQFGRVDDAGGAKFYSFPSIAVNSQNDVLLGFSTFSGSQYASGGYAFRASGDASSTMRDPAVLKAGLNTYYKNFSGPDNRWGDYSATVVDPVNDMDFWTIQEYASTPHFPDATNYGRWGTWWGKIVSPSGVSKKRRGQLVSD